MQGRCCKMVVDPWFSGRTVASHATGQRFESSRVHRTKTDMNILFFSRLFYPHIGGVEKHVLEISKILIKKGHKIVVVAEEHQKSLEPREKFEGVEVYRIPNLKDNWLKKFHIWKWMWRHRGLIKRANIVHCHDVFFWYLPFRFLFFKKPIYTTFHGYEDYPLKSKFIIMHKISEKLSLGNICIGDFMKKWYKTKPTYVSYGGVNLIESSEFGIQESESAVFIGRLDEHTGIRVYVNAVREIRKKIPSFRFTVIGDGKLRKNIAQDILSFGFQRNPERFLKESHFAFVSRYLSILEAMAAKRLVFAVYDNPLKEDYLRMTSFAKFINIVNSKNELVEKIMYFLKKRKEEDEMTKKAFEWVKTKRWEDVAQLYLLLWKKTLL